MYVAVKHRVLSLSFCCNMCTQFEVCVGASYQHTHIFSYMNTHACNAHYLALPTHFSLQRRVLSQIAVSKNTLQIHGYYYRSICVQTLVTYKHITYSDSIVGMHRLLY